MTASDRNGDEGLSPEADGGASLMGVRTGGPRLSWSWGHWPTLAVPVVVGVALGATMVVSAKMGFLLLAAAVAVVAMALWRDAAYYAIVATVPLALVLGDVSVAAVVIPVALACTVANVLIGRWQLRNPFEGPEGLLGVIFFGLSLASILQAEEHYRGLQAARGYLIHASYYFATRAFVQDVRDLRRVVWVLIAIGVVESVIAVAQVHLRFALPGTWRTAGAPGGVAESFAYLERATIRAEGTAGHPLALAAFLQTAMVLAVAQLFGRRHHSLVVRGALVGGVALMAYGWLNTYARGSMVAVAAMAVFAVMLTSVAGRVLVGAGAAAAMLVLLLYGGSVVDAVKQFGDSEFFRRTTIPSSLSAGLRIESAVAGLRLFLDHFWFGVGLGESVALYEQYLPSSAVSRGATIAVGLTPPIHNAFVIVAAESGIFAFAAFCALWALGFRAAQRARGHPELGSLAVALLIVLVGQLTFALGVRWLRDIWVTLPLAMAAARIRFSER